MGKESPNSQVPWSFCNLPVSTIVVVSLQLSYNFVLYKIGKAPVKNVIKRGCQPWSICSRAYGCHKGGDHHLHVPERRAALADMGASMHGLDEAYKSWQVRLEKLTCFEKGLSSWENPFKLVFPSFKTHLLGQRPVGCLVCKWGGRIKWYRNKAQLTGTFHTVVVWQKKLMTIEWTVMCLDQKKMVSQHYSMQT